MQNKSSRNNGWKAIRERAIRNLEREQQRIGYNFTIDNGLISNEILRMVKCQELGRGNND
jgi:hypothetical protein